MKRLLIVSAAATLCACATDHPPPEVVDTCYATDYQSLVGKSRILIPRAPVGAWWRVARWDSPPMPTYEPERITFYYDAQGKVTQVRCG